MEKYEKYSAKSCAYDSIRRNILLDFEYKKGESANAAKKRMLDALDIVFNTLPQSASYEDVEKAYKWELTKIR